MLPADNSDEPISFSNDRFQSDNFADLTTSGASSSVGIESTSIFDAHATHELAHDAPSDASSDQLFDHQRPVDAPTSSHTWDAGTAPHDGIPHAHGADTTDAYFNSGASDSFTGTPTNDGNYWGNEAQSSTDYGSAAGGIGDSATETPASLTNISATESAATTEITSSSLSNLDGSSGTTNANLDATQAGPAVATDALPSTTDANDTPVFNEAPSVSNAAPSFYVAPSAIELGPGPSSDGPILAYNGDLGTGIGELNSSSAGSGSGSGSSGSGTVSQTSGAGSGLIIDIDWDSSVSSAPSGFVTAVNSVVSFYESHFSNPVTITIDVGYGEIDGTALQSDALGESESDLTYVTLFAASDRPGE